MNQRLEIIGKVADFTKMSLSLESLWIKHQPPVKAIMYNIRELASWVVVNQWSEWITTMNEVISTGPFILAHSVSAYKSMKKWSVNDRDFIDRFIRTRTTVSENPFPGCDSTVLPTYATKMSIKYQPRKWKVTLQGQLYSSTINSEDA